jgi:hypothetical protein
MKSSYGRKNYVAKYDLILPAKVVVNYGRADTKFRCVYIQDLFTIGIPGY